MTGSGRLPGVCVVGCGLIGRKRAASLAAAGARLASCADTVPERVESVLASAPGSPGASGFSDWRAAVLREDVEIVVVATTNDALAEVSAFAASAGRHVLVEKPAGRTSSEVTAVAEAAGRAGVRVRVGFNHRYHPGIAKALSLARDGSLGRLMFLRALYGHGGRPGYDREWRADPSRSGGGELVDQGVHLIDLARQFLGELPKVSGFAGTYYWDMPVDDNAFMILRTADDRAAFLHVSCTEWKNMFSLEVYGDKGKAAVRGIGGSYGTERTTFYRMLPEMGPPETTSWEYPFPDRSWEAEMREFLEDVRAGREPSASLSDAYEALRVAEKVYGSSSPSSAGVRP